MYTKLEIFTDENQNLKFNEVQDYTFAESLKQTRIAASEIFNASRSYPVLFSKNTEGYQAIALFSISPQRNAFINNGLLVKGEYIPQSLKNYPFVYVQNNGELNLAYNKDKDYISDEAKFSIYKENASHSDKFTEKLNELNTFQISVEEMSETIKLLDKAGVLEYANQSITIGNKQISLNGFMYINEKKLHDLKDKSLMKLVKSGAYKVATAQLISMNNFSKLL